MAITTIAALAAKLSTATVVERKVRKKVSEDAMGILVHESKKNVTVKATVSDAQAAAAAALLRTIARADIPHHLTATGFDATAATLAQAQALAAVEHEFNVASAQDLRDLVTDAVTTIKTANANKVKGCAAALGAAGQHGAVLALVASLDFDRLAAAMPGAAARVQAAEAAKADAAAATAAKKAEREARLAQLDAAEKADVPKMTPAMKKAFAAWLASAA